MLYLAIPAHNEAATIGVLLWRLRTVLAEFPREYEAVVYDDASNDSTSEILESYARVMPLTVLRGERKIGYAGAVDALVRHVSRHTRYPRRDAMLLLQGDFTDSPQLVPEFVKRFEGGTDVVVGERGTAVRRKAPTPVRRLMRAEPWLLRFFVKAEGIRDLTSSYRLVRISVLRDLLRTVGDSAVCVGDARTANADFLMRLVPLARRVEGLPVEPTWEVRLRDTRVDAMADGIKLLKWAWSSRGRKAVPSTAPEVVSDAPRQGRPGRESRADLPADVAVTVAESGRGSLRDAGTRTRRNKPVRGEGRADVRNEVRANSRADGRPEERADGTDTRAQGRDEKRPDDRADSRNEQRPGRNENRAPRTESRADSRREAQPENVTPEMAGAALAVDGALSGEEPVRERPPRRKRTRGGRRNGAASEVLEGGEPSDANASKGGVTPPVGMPDFAAGRDDSADDARVDFELSPALSEAVADAEAELDIPGHTRPARKKRRRRGGRGGRGAGQAAGDDDASPDSEASVRAREDRDDDEAGDTANAGESRSARSSGSDSGVEESAAEFAEGDDGGGTDGQERVRRRGRRGRRGGSRRSRAARGETSGEFSGEGEVSGPDSGDSVSRVAVDLPGRAAGDGSAAGGPPAE